MITTNEPPLMTYQQAADYLGLSLSYIKTMRRRTDAGYDGIPFVRIGTNVRFKKADLDAWVEERTKR
jgi:excisionase family DNA binding protein